MGRSVKISTIQLPASPRGSNPGQRKSSNLEAILANVSEAGRRESDVAVFGEMANIMGLGFDRKTLEEHADPVPGPLLDALCGAAREHSLNLIAPVIARMDGRLRNAALVIDRDGSLVGAYLKTHLPAPEADAGVVPGDELPVFKLDFGRIGIMTCMDIEYPEVALCLMLGGAEVLFFPHVQSSWGELDWEARYRTRAIDTGLHLVSASYGVRRGEPWRPGMMLGRSGIIGPDGLTLAEASRYAEVVTREIVLGAGRVTDFHFGRLCERSLAVRASRRPELYSLLCDPKTRAEAERLVADTAPAKQGKERGSD